MSKKIKLIWDFRGTEADATAKHHAKHLAEYVSVNELKNTPTGYKTFTSIHSIAYITVPERDMPGVRDALKPQRGEYVS